MSTTKKPLEKSIEAAVCLYARSKGVLAYKFTSPARSAVPDRLMIAPGGRVFFVELKRTGAKATPAQLREHETLRAHGATVFVIDNVADGKAMVDLMVMSL